MSGVRDDIWICVVLGVRSDKPCLKSPLTNECDAAGFMVGKRFSSVQSIWRSMSATQGGSTSLGGLWDQHRIGSTFDSTYTVTDFRSGTGSWNGRKTIGFELNADDKSKSSRLFRYRIFDCVLPKELLYGKFLELYNWTIWKYQDWIKHPTH